MATERKSRQQKDAAHEIEMSIKAILMVPKTSAAVVLLKEEPGEREVPIWVGAAEVRAIGLQVENYEPPRPFTHDLIRELLRELDVRVTKVVIHDVQDNTFFAHIHLEQAPDAEPPRKTARRQQLAVDARPSDAIAVALRTRAPIFVHSRVMEQSARPAEEAVSEPPQDSESLTDWLEGLDEDDLGHAH